MSKEQKNFKTSRTIRALAVFTAMALIPLSGCGENDTAATVPAQDPAQSAVAELIPEVEPEDSSRVIQIERSDSLPVSNPVNPTPTGTVSIAEPPVLDTKDPTPTPTPSAEDDAAKEKDPNTTGNGTPIIFSVGDCTYIALGSVDKAMATEIFNAINVYRTRANLPPLEANMSLEFCSDARVRESTACFNHTRPNGAMWYTVAPAYYKAELLAKDYGTAQDTVDAWMNTATGRQYLLSPDLLSIGITVFKSDGRNFIVAGLGD